MNTETILGRYAIISLCAILSATIQSCDNKITDDGDDKPKGHFSLMQVTNVGDSQMMSYIISTGEGNVIVIDGGNAEDAGNLKHILKTQYGNKVTAWWITHPHSDHMGALCEMLDDEDKPEIESIYHSRFSETILKLEAAASTPAKKFYSALDTLGQTRVFGNVHSGEDYDMDGIRIKVLGAANEEIKVNAYDNSSIILRLEDDTKSVLFLSDTGEESGEKVMKKFRKYLDCDYIQMADHGQKGVGEEFYKAIRFNACLWPVTKRMWEAAEGNADGLETWRTRRWMNDKGIMEHHVMWEEKNWYLE